jgi:hypothetical protein
MANDEHQINPKTMGANLTLLEQTLIDNARTHQEALAAFYPLHQAGQSDEDAHAEYLKHSGALSGLLMLTQHQSGLGQEAAIQLREIEAEDMATFKKHFPVSAKEIQLADASTTANIVDQASTHIFIGELPDDPQFVKSFLASFEALGSKSE